LSDEDEEGVGEPRKPSPKADLEDLLAVTPGAGEERYFGKESVSLSSRSPAPSKSDLEDSDDEGDERDDSDDDPVMAEANKPPGNALDSYLAKWGAKLNG
jgi:hypothetical protein